MSLKILEKIFICGHKGMVGSSLLNYLKIKILKILFLEIKKD